MNDIQHPDIERIERLGYPSQEYLEFESEAEGVEDEEFWPDGLSWKEWRKTH